MTDTNQIGAEDSPEVAEEVKKAAEEAETHDNITLGDVFKALRELTVQVGTLAKEQKEMKERHDKWIKAGKF